MFCPGCFALHVGLSAALLRGIVERVDGGLRRWGGSAAFSEASLQVAAMCRRVVFGDRGDGSYI